MQKDRISAIVRRHALAMGCIIGPIFFAVIATDATVEWLMPESVRTIPMDFEFASGTGGATLRQISGSTTTVLGAASTPAATRGNEGSPPPPKTVQPDPSIYLPAQDISGRLRYAVASAFLYLMSAAGFTFSAIVVYVRLRAKALVVSIVGFTAMAFAIAQNPRSFELIRPLAVDLVLNASDKNPVLKRLAFDGFKTGDIIAGLVHFNTFVALLAVGMLLTALYSVSVRRTGADLSFEDLQTRRLIARCLLGFGSAIFVISVLASKVLVEWPPSLLIKPQELALKPIGEACTIHLGAMGTIGLLGAFGPAIVAYVLDVRSFRSRTPRAQPNRMHPMESDPVEKPVGGVTRTGRSREDLGFAPLSSIVELLGVLAPVLASPLVEIVTAIFEITHS